MGPASNPANQKPLLHEILSGRTAATPANAFMFQ